jgi:hypothetical protein
MLIVGDSGCGRNEIGGAELSLISQCARARRIARMSQM